MVPETENVEVVVLLVTVRVVEAVAPSSSVTVNVTVKLPAVVYVCVATWPTPDCPLPKFQAYDVIDPSESVDALASAVTRKGVAPLAGVTVKLATGATLAGGGGGGGGAEPPPPPPPQADNTSERVKRKSADRSMGSVPVLLN